MEAKKQKKLTAAQEKSRKKKLVDIVKDLQSSEDVVVLDALVKVKEHGDASVIPHLVSIYTQNENTEVQSAVKSVFVGLKDNETIHPLFKILDEESLTEEQSAFLTSVFWEAGLDVSQHLDQLIDIALNKGFLTCIEVMTIVENLEDVDHESLEKNLLRLKRIRERERSDKDALYLNILEILNEKLIG